MRLKELFSKVSSSSSSASSYNLVLERGSTELGRFKNEQKIRKFKEAFVKRGKDIQYETNAP